MVEPDSTSTAPSKIYDRAFLLSYISNLFMMIGISLLFRYEDFVLEAYDPHPHIQAKVAV